jgi:glycosyltransferase involved in cell wall biosynthesis
MTDGGPRIGLFTPGWPGQNTPNGIATAVFQLAMGLHRTGHTPVIVAEHLDGTAPEGIPVVHIPDLGWCWQDRLRGRLGDPDVGHWHRARRIAAGVRQAQETHGVDAFIMEETNGWAGLVQRLVSCPVCITLHGPWVLLQPWVSVEKVKADRQRERREHRALRRAAGIIAPSRNVLRGIEESVPLPHTPKAVLPNALRAARPLRAFPAERAGDILFVGRFDFLKGADTVLEAFSLLSETHPQARLTFVGVDKGLRREDGEVQHMEAALAAMPETARRRIHYTGPLDWPQIARLRDSHPIALIASR